MQVKVKSERKNRVESEQEIMRLRDKRSEKILYWKNMDFWNLLFSNI